MLAAALLMPWPARADIPYEVKIEAGGDKDLAKMLNAASRLKELSERPPPTETALRRRIDDDIERLHQVLRAEGYYAGTIEPQLDLKAAPAQIRITVRPGPRYTLASATLLRPDQSPLQAV